MSALVMVGAMLAVGSTAQAADKADPRPAVGGATPSVTKIPVTGGVSTLSYDANCFGYTGTFKDGSFILVVDWEDADSNADECFGISPGRLIWHAWPGSGSWVQMPNNGRADNMVGAYYSIDGRRGVKVRVAASGNVFCSTRNFGPGWGAWFIC